MPRRKPMFPPRSGPALDLLTEPTGRRRGRTYATWQRLRSRLLGTTNLYGLADRGLRLGAGVYLARGVSIDWGWAWLISIGEKTTLAPNVTVLAHDASTKALVGYTRVAPVSIGARVFIGAGATVLPGVVIGDEAIVAAGSIVSQDVAPGTVVAGNPARAIATSQEHADRHRELLAGAPRYGREFSVPGGVTTERKLRMRSELAGSAGYVK